MTNDLIVFAPLKAEISAFVAPTKLIAVTDFASCQKAVDAAKAVKAFRNQVEKKRKELTDPLNARAKAIKAYADDIAVPLEEAEAFLKKQMIAFEIKQEEIRQAEHRRLESERIKREEEEAAKAAQALADLEALSATDDDVASVFGVDEDRHAVIEAEKETMLAQIETDRKVREAEHKSKAWDVDQQKLKSSSKIWKCELVDINLVPKEFLIRTLNTAMVLASARGGVTDIPGVRVYQEMSVRIGSKTYVPQAAIDGERD